MAGKSGLPHRPRASARNEKMTKFTTPAKAKGGARPLAMPKATRSPAERGEKGGK